ncbi:MAG TPA: hypothetical protein VKV80_01985 [Streptosporangiaceae bacterium]|nr:hypothetical protein [Streptosporangiaceae bacterium]
MLAAGLIPLSIPALIVLGASRRQVGIAVLCLAGAGLSAVATPSYLLGMLGSSARWVRLIRLLMAGIFIYDVLITGGELSSPPLWHLGGAVWIAMGVAEALLALIITPAIVNGERWLRRNYRDLPGDEFERRANPRGSRASVWLRW